MKSSRSTGFQPVNEKHSKLVTRATKFLLCALSVSAMNLSAQTIDQVIASKRDLWGEAALKIPNGPTYDYFEKLLPPLRYVDADFRCYPIVLAAPNSTVKGRLVSDGSAINALVRQPVWVNETGTPAIITVGNNRVPFGQDLASLAGPHLAEGFLPIYSLKYTHDAQQYGEEVFAAVDDTLAKFGAILVRFDLPKNGRVDLHLELSDIAKDQRGGLHDKDGNILLTHDDHWDYYPGRNLLVSKEDYSGPLYVLVLTKPAKEAPVASSEIYQQQKDLAEKTYRGILSKGATFEVPEDRVNNAWRVCLLQQFAMLANDHLNYSAGNQYARQYAHESGESQRSLILYGHSDTVRKTFEPLFVYRRPNIEFHDGAFKLIDLAFYYTYTHDDKLIEELRLLWQKEIDLLVNGRQPLATSDSKIHQKTSSDAATLDNDINGTSKNTNDGSKSAGAHDGLLPREKYCSDIATKVHSLNANAVAWEGLRGMAELLHDDQLAQLAADYRKLILATTDKAIVRTIDPPFIPIALGGEEDVHDPITATRVGSYWNLVVQSLIGTGAFPFNSQYTSDVMRYMQAKGGLCMGMIRVQSERSIYINQQNIDDLYGTRYAILLDQRDEPDRSLVSFYGKLAQGMTRETCVDGESSSIYPTDQFGRVMYLPPNTTANSYFLQQLRYLLVQDFDMNDDGKPETLRLLFATPRQWLEDGKTITIKNAPTAFGDLSCIVARKSNQVTADINLPMTHPEKTLLRLRLPNNQHIASVNTGKLDNDVIDLTGMTGDVHLTAEIK